MRALIPHLVFEYMAMDSIRQTTKPFSLIFIVGGHGADYFYNLALKYVIFFLLIAGARFNICDQVADGECPYFDRFPLASYSFGGGIIFSSADLAFESDDLSYGHFHLRGLYYACAGDRLAGTPIKFKLL